MAGLRYLNLASLLLLGIVLVVGGISLPSEVRAQSGGCPINNTTCDQGTAYAGCMAHGNASLSTNANYSNVQCKLIPGSGSQSSYQCSLSVKSNPSGFNYACPSPRDWYFRTAQSCSVRVDGQAGMINGTIYSGGVCDNGCKVQPNLDPGTNFSIRESGNPDAIPVRSGTWRATGDVCSITDTQPKPEAKDEYCHTTSSGHQVCKGKDKTCVTSQSGFRTCASDTANEKGHTATNNPRTEAASISAPNTPPNAPTNRPGEDWKPSGPTTNITNNNTGTTYNTQNYNNQGTPNGNQPTPGDGSGPGAGGSNGNGEQGEGNGNSASGGGNCQTPPATSGDAILGMIATQTWATRCAAEKGNSATVSGDIGNCDAPFSVEGDSVQANQLRAQRAQLCAGRPGEGQGSGGSPHDGADVDGPGKWSWKFDEDLIDTSGFGGGSCPQLGTIDFGRFGAVSLDGTTWWCSLIGAIRTVMLLLGMFISFRIVFGD